LPAAHRNPVTNAKGKRIRAKVGNVFVVPISGDERVYGQVVDQAGPQFLVVLFRSTSGSVEDVVGSGIELAGIVFDAKLSNGDWPIVSNIPPVEVKSPWFVVGHEGLENLRLENFDGSATRLVRPAEAAKHRHRHISYPMVLQRAAEALHGQREWQEDLDFLRDLASELGGHPGSN
jgi:hypothetical protein